MKILMLAPEPFFQPRGTPISVYFRLQALSSMGHQVDLITYHLGEDRTFPGVRILRIPNLFGIRKVKIGPSLAKIPLDFLMLKKALWRLTFHRYDLIFSHEEAALIGAALGRFWRIPHIYDMHSSLPQQLENFNFSRSAFLKSVFNRIERFILKRSQAIIVICPDLFNQVRTEGHHHKAVLLENFLDFKCPEFSRAEIEQKRREYGEEDVRIVLYTGNFQPYQGIDLLMAAAARISDPRVVFLLVGDTPEAVTAMRSRTKEMKIGHKVFFTGQVEPTQIPLYIGMADVLVSPRLSGTNTPLKLYTFLKSGKPLVATRLWTHTQILTDDIAVLVDPEAESLAQGLQAALFDESARAKARAAREKAEREYTFPRYLEKLGQVLSLAAGDKRDEGRPS